MTLTLHALVAIAIVFLLTEQTRMRSEIAVLQGDHTSRSKDLQRRSIEIAQIHEHLRTIDATTRQSDTKAVVAEQAVALLRTSIAEIRKDVQALTVRIVGEGAIRTGGLIDAVNRLESEMTVLESITTRDLEALKREIRAAGVGGPGLGLGSKIEDVKLDMGALGTRVTEIERVLKRIEVR